MGAYIQGNLAVDQNQAYHVHDRKKTVYRRKSISMKEKIFYLLTIIVCVSIAGFILARYAQIYEMNTKIQEIEKQIELLEKENVNLKLEASRLKDPKRLLGYALEYGLKPPGEQDVRTVAPSEMPLKESGAYAYIIRGDHGEQTN